MDSCLKLALRINEAAASIGVGRVRMYQLINEHKVEALRCGNRLVIRPEALERYLQTLPPARQVKALKRAAEAA